MFKFTTLRIAGVTLVTEDIDGTIVLVTALPSVDNLEELLVNFSG